MNYLMVENLSLAIGDEIRVVGIIGSDNWIVAYIETATAIKVIQTGQVVTNAAEAEFILWIGLFA